MNGTLTCGASQGAIVPIRMLFQRYAGKLRDFPLMIGFIVGLVSLTAVADLKANEDGFPLMKAVTEGDFEKVDQLISEGEDLNRPDTDGVTPLRYAVATGDTAMARTLIESGASIFPAADMMMRGLA